MYSVKAAVQIEEMIKKSRFIGIILPCINEIEVLNHLKQLAIQHPNASHIAFAYRIKLENGIHYRFYDAGEPSGTAGKPIFHHIQGKQLINVLIAVIRYFGGIKLGAGGLTRAYGNIAGQVIEAATFIEYIEMAILELSVDYKHISQLEYQLKKYDGQILQQSFAEQIKVLINIPQRNLHNIKKLFTP